jgi:hypothetical protein
MPNKKAPKRKPLPLGKLRKLENIVVEFIEKQEISCPECVSQSDRVIENAYDFIAELCNVAGYYDDGEDDSDNDS